MKAMVITSFGGTEVFAERQVEKPKPGKNEVLVKVHATSVNPADCGARQGMFSAMLQLPAILGYDISGVVEAIGEDVVDLAIGDQVYYATEIFDGGGDAEYHVAPVSIVAKKPANLSHTEAASIPVAGGTAWAALITKADIRIGETVLIHGGAGGVGSFAVQIAKAAGAYVYATCGGYDVELLKSIGVDRVIDYRNENFVDIIHKETGGKGVDVSFTTVSGTVLAESLKVTKENGRAATVTGVAGDLNLAIRKNITVHFVHLEDARQKLESLRTVSERGLVKPVIGKTFPLSQVAEAHKLLEKGGEGVYGKIVLEVA